MKKYIAMLALLLTCQLGYCQKHSVDAIFKEFSSEKNATKVKAGGFMMSLAGMFTETMGVNHIEVYALDECEVATKEKLEKAVRNIKDSSFETMISSNEEGSLTKVLVRIEEDMIRELVVFTTGGSPALIRLKGKIKPSDLERVTQKHGKGGC